MLKRNLLALALLLAFALPGYARAAEIPILDAHSQMDRGVTPEQLMSTLNQAGVSRVILASQKGFFKNREILGLSRRYPDRITPSIGMKGGVVHGREDSLEHVPVQGQNPAFGALSEVIIFHMQKGTRSPEILRTLDDPAMGPALEVVRRRGWPLVVRIEFSYARSLGLYAANMSGLETLLAGMENHPVALNHMGQLSPEETERLIRSFQNIYFLTSHANTEFLDFRENKNSHWTNMFTGHILAEPWRKLIVTYPDRFIMAYGNVQDEDWGRAYVRQVELWRGALRELPEDVAHKLAHGNAERLWHLPPTLERQAAQ
jgi:hypothetical protein